MYTVQINQTRLEIIRGNIIHQKVDAIVNAANTSLLGGGGVDGAIHRAAGRELMDATSRLHGCKTGDAKITKGYRLPVKYIIHAVGPVYEAEPKVEPQNTQSAKLLASAYQRSLEIAVENSVRTIAFPAISTGTYRFPMTAAAYVSLSIVCQFALDNTTLELIRFVLFDDDGYQRYVSVLESLFIQQKFPLLELE
jgi:O-acetyl-ADP-ribose deacetylase